MRDPMRRTLAAALLLSALAVPAARAATGGGGPCAGAPAGGSWTSYGNDVAGTRSQPAEHLIGPSTVGSLKVAWVGSSTTAPSGQSTPTVAGRCVYAAGAGYVSAVDVVTGLLVWRTPLPNGGLTYAVNVTNGRVHVNMDNGATASGAAFDADSGALLWQSVPIDFGYPVDQVASAIVYDGKQLLPTNGPDSDPRARPGIAVLDAATGAVLVKHTTIPSDDLDRGYAGGGIWATPVVDDAGFAYVGTAQPYSKAKEHRYDNAILKIDLRGDVANNPTFGQIVDAYKGNVDSYVPGLNRQPACDIAGDSVQYHPSGFSVACVQFDVDFGASPTLFHNSAGELLVGELQKSGVFHAVYADTMESAWDTIVSTLPPATGGNTSSAANDGHHVYVMANPGVVYSLDIDTGAVQWATPLPVGTLENHPVAVANGVVYVMMNSFHVYGLDAATGQPRWVTNATFDAGTMCSQPSGGGIAIAANSVIVNCDGRLVTYRLPF